MWLGEVPVLTYGSGQARGGKFNFFFLSDFGNHSCVDTAIRIEAPSVFQFQE